MISEAAKDGFSLPASINNYIYYFLLMLVLVDSTMQYNSVVGYDIKFCNGFAIILFGVIIKPHT